MRETEKHEPKPNEPQNVWEEFGLTRPRYEDERNAPHNCEGVLDLAEPLIERYQRAENYVTRTEILREIENLFVNMPSTAGLFVVSNWEKSDDLRPFANPEDRASLFPASSWTRGKRVCVLPFGLTRPCYEDERNAPPVDRERLRALVEKRLPLEERREVYRLTIRFRSWAEALAELYAETLKKETGGPRGSIRLWDGAQK